MRVPMHPQMFAITAAISSSVLLATSTVAGTIDVTVDATAGPWSQLLNPLDPYGTGDNSAPTIVTGLIAGQNVTIA